MAKVPMISGIMLMPSTKDLEPEGEAGHRLHDVDADGGDHDAEGGGDGPLGEGLARGNDDDDEGEQDERKLARRADEQGQP